MHFEDQVKIAKLMSHSIYCNDPKYLNIFFLLLEFAKAYIAILSKTLKGSQSTGKYPGSGGSVPK